MQPGCWGARPQRVRPPSSADSPPSPPPEQYAVDELLRAFMQRVEIDEQVIIYLEMTQVRRGAAAA